MKRNYFVFAALLSSLFLFQSFSGSNGKYPGGSPGGYTGSPFDAKNCTQCHGGTSGPVTNWITSNVPVTGYVPGTSYTITVTVTGSGRKGFEVSPQTLAGALVGTLTAGTGQHLVNGAKAVTQSSASPNNSNPATWNFTWVAPVAGTGPVTFYGAFTVGKSVTKLSTTVIPEYTTGISDLLKPGFIVYPNPACSYVNLSYHAVGQAVKVQLYSMDGRRCEVIYEDHGNTGFQQKQITLPENLVKGIYLLKFSNGNSVETQKIFID